jgi:hypothetical protein
MRAEHNTYQGSTIPRLPHKEAIKTIERLPDDAPLDEIVYRLFVLNKIRQGIQDIDTGRVISSEALAREIGQW